MYMADISNKTFFQAIIAIFVAFVLAYVTTKYLDRFERFPPPLVTPGMQGPDTVQGRDYIPYRVIPTVPPGPPSPLPVESNPKPRETAPPIAEAKPGAMLPYPMTNDDYLSFVENSEPVTTAPPKIM